VFLSLRVTCVVGGWRGAGSDRLVPDWCVVGEYRSLTQLSVWAYLDSRRARRALWLFLTGNRELWIENEFTTWRYSDCVQSLPRNEAQVSNAGCFYWTGSVAAKGTLFDRVLFVSQIQICCAVRSIRTVPEFKFLQGTRKDRPSHVSKGFESSGIGENTFIRFCRCSYKFSSVSYWLENRARFSGNHTENPLTREFENGNRKIWFVSGGGNLSPCGQIVNLLPKSFTMILYFLFPVKNNKWKQKQQQLDLPRT
jgi:hypothetical protein